MPFFIEGIVKDEDRILSFPGMGCARLALIHDAIPQCSSSTCKLVNSVIE